MENKIITFLLILGHFATIFAENSPSDSIAMSRDLDEIVVASTRLGTTFAGNSQTIDSETLQKQNIGANLPCLLAASPSLVTMSDDGLGIGYTYFRVRGTNQNRINITLNSIPLNDAESHSVFWVNLTDLASNVNSANLQRGVGSSQNGAAAFGASLNMQTNAVEQSPFAEISFNGGMYNTFRESAKIGTGLMKNGFAFDARFSKVNSKGYIERSASDLYSYSASAAWYGTKNSVKLLVFGGAETTQMAWDGISAEMLAENRRYNAAGRYVDDNGNPAFYENQTDNYAQTHVQLHTSHHLSKNFDLNAALHYTFGKGFYEQYKENAKFANYNLENFTDTAGNEVKKSDLVRQKWLKNHFFGGIFALNFYNSKVKAAFGGGINRYLGQHWGEIDWLRNYHRNLPQNLEYYRNNGDKTDANIYLKGDWEVVRGLQIYGDLQYRFVNYKISGINDEDLKPIPVNENFHFFNPKIGINYTQKNHQVYANFAIANREPSRNNYTESGEKAVPKAEQLHDYEVGYSYKHPIFTVSANFYFMNYKNQLILTGKQSDTGAYLTKNIEKSYRTGIELLFGVMPCNWFRWDGNLTLSRNKIVDYTDWVDDWDSGEQVQVTLGTTDIAFSPNITAVSNFQFDIKGFEAALQTNYVGEQFLDNSANSATKLDDYCVTNLNLSYTFLPKKVVKKCTFSVQMNNLFNKMYVANGGAYSYFESGKQHFSPWYFPQAGFNIHAGFSVKF